MKPVVFWIHFNKFNAKRGSKDIWTVRYNRKNHYAKRVLCNASCVTVYRGDSAPQPRAYLKGVGTIHRTRDGIVIKSP